MMNIYIHILYISVAKHVTDVTAQGIRPAEAWAGTTETSGCWDDRSAGYWDDRSARLFRGRSLMASAGQPRNVNKHYPLVYDP